MSVIGSNILAGASGSQVAVVEDTGRSLRFNSGDSARLTRTQGTPTTSGTWTASVWVKRSKIGSNSSILGGRKDGDATQIYFKSDNTLRWYEAGADMSTDHVFRDVSAWSHFVFVKNGTSSCKIYHNGVEIKETTSSVPSTSKFNTSGAELFIGAIGLLPTGITYHGDHLLADFIFIDGQALDESSFGAFDSNGVWQKADYSGTFGSNGFHLLDFENESTVGHDSSGNGNDFTANNISTSAGAGNDVLFDFPANGSGTDFGAGAQINGNYCTFNPVDSNQTHSNGSLFVTCAGGTSPRAGTGTVAVSSGKYYYEITVTESDAAKGIIGFVEAAYDGNGSTIPNANGNSVFYFGENGNKFIDGSATSYGASYGNNDVIGVALNLDDDEITFYKNGTSQGTITTKTFTGAYKPAVGRGASSGSTSYTLNAGQRVFTHAAPSGFKCLNTASLPTPTVPDGSDYFDIQLWTGNATDNRDITGYGFSPDFVWIKERSSTGDNHLFDIVRGATKALRSNNTDAEVTDANELKAFNTDGFRLGTGGDVNASNTTTVGWAWDAGSSTVSNTDGNITSNVRANQTAGFSIVSFNLSVANTEKSVGHGLNAAPTFYVIKNRSSADNWYAYTTAVDGTLDFKYLNTDGALSASSRTLPTSSVFHFASSTTGNHIAYCFTPVAGYSAVGSWTAGSAAFVHLGFRPRFLMVKGNASGHSWLMFDSARSTYNRIDDWLAANESSTEVTGNSTNYLDFLSNGFKIRGTGGYFGSGAGTVLYLAFAENPFQANGGLAR